MGSYIWIKHGRANLDLPISCGGDIINGWRIYNSDIRRVELYNLFDHHWWSVAVASRGENVFNAGWKDYGSRASEPRVCIGRYFRVNGECQAPNPEFRCHLCRKLAV